MRSPADNASADDRTEPTDNHDNHDNHDDDSDELTVVLKSTFVPGGEVACREYTVETESIPPGHEPDHWPTLAEYDTGRLLLDTDDLRAVWTGPGSWEGGGRR
jgi:hypothetical protein